MEDNIQILKDSFDFKYLISNTKLRRLGYLKVLLSMFTNNEEYAVSSFNKKFELFAIEFEPFLLGYKNTKGVIKETKNGISASPYVELALNLGLIIKNAYAYQLGKSGKVYNILQKELDLKWDNPFQMSMFDITFFLELLLREDYWFLYNILDQTMKASHIKYINLKKIFKQVLLENISEIKYKYTDEVSNKKVGDIEERLKKWNDKDSYMEHILMPRLNWLYDLNLIELKKDLSYTLTSYGVALFQRFVQCNNIAHHTIISAEDYLNNFYLKIINDIFDLSKKRFNFAVDTDILDMYLNQSFDLFKTLAPNRTTFSLFANYAKLMLFFKHSIVIDEGDIRFYYGSKNNTKYIFKYQEQYKDGFIQKI